MGDCFIHYGSSIFKQFQDVELCQPAGNRISGSLIFNSLSVDGKNCCISEIFLGWSYAVFLVGGKLHYCGFKNDSTGTCKISHDAVKDRIVNVACGWKEMVIVTEYGGCYLCKTNSFDLTKVDVAGIKVRNVAIGDEHLILLTDCGQIFAINYTDVSVMLRPVKLRTVITAIACGKDYALLLSFEGRVFTYGTGSRGQLGHGDINPRESPTLVEALDGIKIKCIAAGGWHAAAVSDIGDLYVWGWNESGQLGLPCAACSKQKMEETVAFQSIPRLVDFNPEITVTSASCGSRHTAILTDEGIVWTWGWNAYGQLGASRDVCSDVPMPLELPPGFCVSKVTCAYWSTLIAGKYTVSQ